MTQTKKPAPQKPKNIAILTIEHLAYALPVDDALAVVKLMQNAEPLKRDYLGSGIAYSRSGMESDLQVEVVPASKVKQ